MTDPTQQFRSLPSNSVKALNFVPVYLAYAFRVAPVSYNGTTLVIAVEENKGSAQQHTVTAFMIYLQINDVRTVTWAASDIDAYLKLYVDLIDADRWPLLRTKKFRNIDDEWEA